MVPLSWSLFHTLYIFQTKILTHLVSLKLYTYFFKELCYSSSTNLRWIKITWENPFSGPISLIFILTYLIINCISFRCFLRWYRKPVGNCLVCLNYSPLITLYIFFHGFSIDFYLSGIIIYFSMCPIKL